MPRARLIRLLPAALASLLAATLLSAAPGAPAAATPVAQADPTPVAEEALEVVEELLDDTSAALQPPTPTTPASRQDLTLALRDLALVQDQLPPAERRRAAAYLARPTDPPDPGVPDHEQDPTYAGPSSAVCSTFVCVHYVRKGVDARHGVPRGDDGEPYGTAGNQVPDYVDLVLAELTSIHRKYVAAGYDAPLPDDGIGVGAPDGPHADKTDVYLADIGGNGIYGYCTTDDEDAGRWNKHIGVHAYCVLDNDYRTGQFPFHTPRQNLQVTAAHEYFHAIQFGYDIAEDGWFMEATATWAEDELYDKVDDNVSYLARGPIGRPQQPLDSFRGLYHYGAWIFFRHLTERYPAKQGPLPRLVREMWDLARGDGQNLYSLHAINRALTRRDTTLRQQFVRFATKNRRARQAYDEGRANRYPFTELAGRAVLTPGSRSARTVARLDHLTSRTHRFVPGRGLGPGRYLRLQLDLPRAARGGAATFTVKRTGRAPVTRQVPLGPRGNKVVGGKRIPFTRGRVQWVEVTLVNASRRYDCNSGFGRGRTCRGRALDDDRRFVLRATAVRR